jgi:hypothetical protein
VPAHAIGNYPQALFAMIEKRVFIGFSHMAKYGHCAGEPGWAWWLRGGIGGGHAWQAAIGLK